MNKIKSFFIGCLLLAIGFAMVILVTLVYRANEQETIKSYIFQMNNFASERVGELQDIKDISANDLRNKLIKKYVSEYFKVIPGDKDVTNRPVLKKMSSENAFKQWENDEAKTIEDMSDQNMFRMVRVMDDGIATITKKKNINYDTDDLAERIYYAVRYYMYTWHESNKMGTQPTYEQGTLYIEAKFKPGIRPDVNIRKDLEKGLDPAGLFMFQVTNIGNKEDI